MNRLRGDILFNRALLWLLFGAAVSRYGEHKSIAMAYLLLAAYNLVKLFLAWMEDE